MEYSARHLSNHHALTPSHQLGENYLECTTAAGAKASFIGDDDDEMEDMGESAEEET
jgi:hypothetical protein